MKREHSQSRFSASTKILTALVIVIAASTISFGPHFAQAQVGPVVPAFDYTNSVINSTTAKNTTAEQVKESFLDGIINAAAKVVISNITESIVTWINSGFKGGPVFITDPANFFTGVADKVAGNFIAGTELGFMCQPFALDIRLALNLSYSTGFARNYCKLSDVIGNTQNFAKFTEGDFSQGGWNSWFQISQTPSNNPLGGFLAAQGELDARIASSQTLNNKLLDWGKGFMSISDCEEQDADGKCIKDGPIKTPGSVVESQLEETLGVGLHELELADEVNEVVGALVGQVAQTALTQGLSSFGPGGSNSGTIGTLPTAPPLNVYCYADRDTAVVGDTVEWTVSVYGGSTGVPTYFWGGDEMVGANTTSVDVSYTSPGKKTATVTVTKGGQNLFQNCSTEVRVF